MYKQTIATTSKIKKRIFSLFLVLLFIPLIQFTFPFGKEKPLDGLDPAPPLPVFSTATWMNEEYQKIYAPTFEQNVGFHTFFVRLQNQINYSVFGYSDVENVVVGKKGYIYLKSYTNAITGQDFVGSEYINIQTQKMKVLQAELKKISIDFFVVLAPGKGSFYSEFVPNNILEKIRSDSTNYFCYKKMFAEQEVNCLDLNAYFLAIKSTEKFPLYSTTGVHWTQYGAFVAGREIVNYVQKLRDIYLPNITVQSIEMLNLSGKYSSDYDAACLMNIFTTLPHPSYAIPKLKYTTNTSTTKPHFLCIADSYFAGIVNTGIPGNVFTDYRYWLYYDRVYESVLKTENVADLNLKTEIEKQDVVCLLATDASLGLFPFGFVDKAYEIYAKKDAAYYALKNKEFHCFVIKAMQNINNNKAWKAQLNINAKNRNVTPIDEYIKASVWLYEQEQLKLKDE
jgi:hypothetical protein